MLFAAIGRARRGTEICDLLVHKEIITNTTQQYAKNSGKQTDACQGKKTSAVKACQWLLASEHHEDEAPKFSFMGTI